MKRHFHSAAVLALWLLASACGPEKPKALQGYVEGEYARIAAPFAGTLVKLEARRGQEVAIGAPLFALEAENESAARRESEERVRRAEAQLEDLRKGRRATEIEAVRQQLAQAEATALLSQKELARQEDLVTKGFVSRQRLDEARAARDRDRSRVAELQAELATARSGARPDELRAAQAEAQAAKAALAQAEWRLRQKSVASTVAGTVTDTLYVQGEWVAAGAPVVTLLPPGNIKARFFVPETRLGEVKVGQGVELACDGCGRPIPARVTFIAPQAEYTPPVIYSRESRSKLVFLVEARPEGEQAARLHPGQPVDVTLK
jgi:HlyD family secretion protein